MKKLIASVLTLCMLAGCSTEVIPQQTHYDKAVDRLYRDIVKYELLYGKMPGDESKKPITEKQIEGMKKWMEAQKDNGNVYNDVSKP